MLSQETAVGAHPVLAVEMMAAIAVTNDFTLVTRRPADFAHFPHLRVEDWIS